MARSYQLTGDNANAKKYFNEYKERFPDGVYYYTVEDQLRKLQ